MSGLTALEIGKNDRGLREMLRLAGESVEGVLMRQVPGKETPIDTEIFNDVAANKTLRLKEKSGAFSEARMRFDSSMGRIDIHEAIDAGANAKAIHIVRSGTDLALMKDHDPGTPYNRRVVEIAAQILGLGLIDELEIGKPLPDRVLIYLQPLPSPEDNSDKFINMVVDAIGRYKPQPITDRNKFDATYVRLVQRLMKSGLAGSKLTHDSMQNTIQQELLRGMVKVEVWRKLWRHASTTVDNAANLRPIPAILHDQRLSQYVRDLESAIRHLAGIIGVFVGNATLLYERALRGTDFYIEAMPAVVYIRESRGVVEEFYTHLSEWTKIWNDADPNASLADMELRFRPHLDTIKKTLAFQAPRAL